MDSLPEKIRKDFYHNIEEIVEKYNALNSQIEGEYVTELNKEIESGKNISFLRKKNFFEEWTKRPSSKPLTSKVASEKVAEPGVVLNEVNLTKGSVKSIAENFSNSSKNPPKSSKVTVSSENKENIDGIQIPQTSEYSPLSVSKRIKKYSTFEDNSSNQSNTAPKNNSNPKEISTNSSKVTKRVETTIPTPEPLIKTEIQIDKKDSPSEYSPLDVGKRIRMFSTFQNSPKSILVAKQTLDKNVDETPDEPTKCESDENDEKMNAVKKIVDHFNSTDPTNHVPTPKKFDKIENFIANKVKVIKQLKIESANLTDKVSENMVEKPEACQPDDKNDVKLPDMSLTMYSSSKEEMERSELKKESIEEMGVEKIEVKNENSEDSLIADMQEIDKDASNEQKVSNILSPSKQQHQSNQYCSTFIDDGLENFNLNAALQEDCKNIENYIETLNDNANTFTTYLKNFDVANSRQIYINKSKLRLSTQKQINQQLINLEKSYKLNNNEILRSEHGCFFLFLKYKTQASINVMEKYLDYCEQESNPINGLIKGSGTLNICNFRLNFSSRTPTHLLTAYFDLCGNTTFLNPIEASKTSCFCEFFQKVTFKELPADFKIRVVLAELPLTPGSVKPATFTMTPKSKSKKKIVEKVKDKTKSLVKKLYTKKAKNQKNLPSIDHFIEVGEFTIDKGVVDASKGEISTAKFLSTSKPPHGALLNGKASMQISLSYSLDLEYSGQVSILRVDQATNNQIWVYNYALLKNGKLFLWHVSEAFPLTDSNFKNSMQDITKNMEPLEVIDLSEVSQFESDASQILTGKPNTMFIELSRKWSATDISGTLQKIVGNLLVRKIFISLSNPDEHKHWSKMLKIIIDSHHEWRS